LACCEGVSSAVICGEAMGELSGLDILPSLVVLGVILSACTRAMLRATIIICVI
jgi:hypothetical protein